MLWWSVSAKGALISQESLRPDLVVRPNTGWYDAVDVTAGKIRAGTCTARRLIDERRWSDRNRCRGSVDPEPGALLFPYDRNACVSREPFCGQFDRMEVAKDRLDDVWCQKTDAQDSGEV